MPTDAGRRFDVDPARVYGYHGGFLSYLINAHGFQTIAEVGVLYGELAKHLLEKCPGIQYYHLVDRWRKYPDKWRCADSLSQEPQEFWDEMFDTMLLKVKPFEDKVDILRMSSLQGAARVGDESLDLVYIDALHHFSPILYDIQAWWPKVGPRGMLAGHDWWDEGTKYAGGMIGVMAAVLTLFPQRIIHTGKPAANWDHAWYVWKDDGMEGPWQAGRERRK